jgi:hypothetical protein
MGLYMRRVTGSWMPHLVFGALLKVLSGMYFVRCASDRTARELLEESRSVHFVADSSSSGPFPLYF